VKIVNEQEIEQQHQELVSKLNRLNNAVSKMEYREATDKHS
jgi:hypothetical protein